MAGRVISLTEKVKVVRGIHGKIQREHRKGIRESDEIDGLRKELAEAEEEVRGDLIHGYGRIEKGMSVNGKFVSPMVLSYCFKHFSSPKRKAEGRSVFDVAPVVQGFMDEVNSRGQRKMPRGDFVLSIQGADCYFGLTPYEGIPCRIEHRVDERAIGKNCYDMVISVVEDFFYELRVEKTERGPKGRWVVPDLQEGEKPKILVDEGIFRDGIGRNVKGEYSGGVWEAIYDGEITNTGRKEHNFSLYLGSLNVNRRLRNLIVIPEIKVLAREP